MGIPGFQAPQGPGSREESPAPKKRSLQGVAMLRGGGNSLKGSAQLKALDCQRVGKRPAQEIQAEPHPSSSGRKGPHLPLPRTSSQHCLWEGRWRSPRPAWLLPGFPEKGQGVRKGVWARDFPGAPLPPGGMVAANGSSCCPGAGFHDNTARGIFHPGCQRHEERLSEVTKNRQSWEG